MTGGGFGGCTINLVRSADAEEFRAHLARGYRAATSIDPDIYVCEPAQGATEWPEIP
jgi:galactokinase